MQNNKQNPKVIIQMPDIVNIELVQANELKHYELFNWLLILLLPIATGFWTAYFTADKKVELLWSSSIFTGVSGLFIFLAYKYRKRVFSKSIRKTATFDMFKEELPNEPKSRK